MPGVLLMPVNSPSPAPTSAEGEGAKVPLDQEVEGDVSFGSALASLVNHKQVADTVEKGVDELLLEGEEGGTEKSGKSLPLDSPGLDLAEETEAEDSAVLALLSSEKTTDDPDVVDETIKNGSAVKSGDTYIEEGESVDQTVNPGGLAELNGVKSEAVIDAVGFNMKSVAHQMAGGLQQQEPRVLSAASADATQKGASTNVQPAFVASLNPMVQKNVGQSKFSMDNQGKFGINGEVKGGGELEGDKQLQLTKGLKNIDPVELKLPQDGLNLDKKLELGMASLKQLKFSPQDSQPNSSSEKVIDDVEMKSPFSRVLEQITTSKIDEPTKTTPAVTVQTPMGKPGFATELGQRMAMMISQKFQSAEIHVHPAELGPVDVRINFNKDQAEVVFSSQNAVTRELLEHSAPRLREMLAENGISLGGLDVQDQAAGRREGQGEFAELGDGDGESDDIESISEDEQRQQEVTYIGSDRLVDFYV